MKFNRSSGILIHISSLPGDDGIGDLGKSAYDFIDFLYRTGTKLWQIIPLNPTGFGNSPYQGLSAFAGNPLFISLTKLYERGLIEKKYFDSRPHFSSGTVEFGKVIEWKMGVLEHAFNTFLGNKNSILLNDYKKFKNHNKQWLDNFALFMTLRKIHNQVSWSQWPKEFQKRDQAAIRKFSFEYKKEIESEKFFQFLFDLHWQELKNYAKVNQITIIGDIPIFVGYDCADVWANPDLFFLGKNFKPTVVAGVPPDFFSKTGQLWGNPLYDWPIHQQNNYKWWINRLTHTLKYVDILRIDHFRGFAGYWEIPAKEKTAEKGRWVEGPGKKFFAAVQKKIPDLPFIAEDLGVITPDVEALRDTFHLPGMKILQFGFDGGPSHEFMPHNYTPYCVAYTGTHDNDTSRGWYDSADSEVKDYFNKYTDRKKEEPAHAMIHTLWSSVATYAIATMQDFLNLNTSARMNYPSTVEGNWIWRMKPGALDKKVRSFLYELNQLYLR